MSFACSIFSKSSEVTNYGFMGVAHLPVSLGTYFLYICLCNWHCPVWGSETEGHIAGSGSGYLLDFSVR